MKTWYGRKYDVHLAGEYPSCGGVIVYYDFVVYDKDDEKIYFVRQLKRKWNIYQVKTIEEESEEYV